MTPLSSAFIRWARVQSGYLLWCLNANSPEALFETQCKRPSHCPWVKGIPTWTCSKAGKGQSLVMLRSCLTFLLLILAYIEDYTERLEERYYVWDDGNHNPPDILKCHTEHIQTALWENCFQQEEQNHFALYPGSLMGVGCIWTFHDC